VTKKMLTKIFCEIDDFMKEFEPKYKQRLIESGEVKRKNNSKLSMSEVMSILVYYHGYGNRTFKDFYTKTVQAHLKSEFPNLVSYNRFVELIPTVLLPLVVFLKLKRLVRSDFITFIDSTKIVVCHNKRIKQNRTFEGIAKRGKSSMGWFYGFKLHIAITETGELCGVHLSKGNVDDRDTNVLDEVLENVSGKLFADKGYISKELFTNLFNQGITLITSIRKNMKNRLIPLVDKLLLRKRSVIETVNDQLKNICNIEHTRHRSPINFLVNMVAGLIRYTYFEKKPSINFAQNDRNLLLQTIEQNNQNTNFNGLTVL
jgi:hypothetical protein